MRFTGGYRFKNFEGTAEPVLRDFPVPKTVFIPAEHTSLSFVPLAQKGDSIRAGQKLFGINNSSPISLVSPVNGTIEEVTEKGITIISDGTASFDPVEGHSRAPWHLERETVFGIFCSSGCVLLLNGHFTSLKDFDTIKYIIINAVHNAPLNQSWMPGMTGYPDIFSNGLKTLSTLFPETEISVAINKRNKKYFHNPEITGHASVLIMTDRYPQEHPELLSRDVLQRRLMLPEGERDDATLILPFLNVIQIAEIMTRGRPFIDRILMIAGPGVSKPGWYRIRIGTPYKEIKRRLLKSDKHGPWRIIRGDLFNGESIPSLESTILPADREISVIRENACRELFRFMNPGFTYDSYSRTTVREYIPLLTRHLDTNVHGGMRPCVQCNYCDEVCPVGIYPLMIWKHVTAGTVEESFRFKPYDCIECRLCDYVCPSKIDISPAVIEAKETYRSLRRSDEESD